VNHILKISASNVKQDHDLRNIFEFFKWNEEKRMFETEIKQEELVKRLKITYDLKMDETIQDAPVVAELDTRQISSKESGNNNSNLTFNKYTANNTHGIYESFNGDLNFSQNRNGKF
jgi:hypothetical protein